MVYCRICDRCIVPVPKWFIMGYGTGTLWGLHNWSTRAHVLGVTYFILTPTKLVMSKSQGQQTKVSVEWRYFVDLKRKKDKEKFILHQIGRLRLWPNFEKCL